MGDGFLWIHSGTLKTDVYSIYLLMLVMGLFEEVVCKNFGWENFSLLP